MSLAAKGRMDSLSGGPDRPVIFLSGYGRDETIARALELGVTDYAVKPFSPTELGGQNPGGSAQAGRADRALPVRSSDSGCI